MPPTPEPAPPPPPKPAPAPKDPEEGGRGYLIADNCDDPTRPEPEAA